jgi:uncharacterized lipoprotein YbaY
MPVMTIVRSTLLGGALLLCLAMIPACATLTAGNGVLSGTMSYPSGTLPPGATATLELVRLESGFAPTLITRASMVPTTASPFPWVLNYDVSAINPEIPHALRATILSPQGSAMYATAGDVPITFDASPIALELYPSTGTSGGGGGTPSTPRR